MSSTLIGITGGIGSGKSVVSRILKTMGYPVYDADKEAGKLLETDPGIIASVKSLLGANAFGADGKPDRPFISSQVFKDAAKLESLNAIIHPAVHRHFHNWVLKNQHSDLLFKEAAILFESGSYKEMNFVVAVTAPEKLRIARVMQRDHKNEAQVSQIMAKQLPENELIKRSSFVIANDENHLVIPQVLAVIEKIKSATAS